MTREEGTWALVLLDPSLLEIQGKVKSRWAVGSMSMEFRGSPG